MPVNVDVMEQAIYLVEKASQARILFNGTLIAHQMATWICSTGKEDSEAGASVMTLRCVPSSAAASLQCNKWTVPHNFSFYIYI